MASEWKQIPIIECIDLIGGGTPKTSVAEYWDGDIPWLSVKDFNNDYRHVYSTEKHITEAGLNNSSTKLLQKDDIIISARGTVGEMAMIPFPMAFNQSCYGIRAKDGINSTFLYYLLKNSISKLKLMTHGSVFDTITRDTFATLIVGIPDKKTQDAIAATLAAIDDKIELNNKINDNLEQQAATVFGDWLSKCTETASIGDLSNNILDYTSIAAEMVRLLNSSDVTEGVFPVAPLVPNKDLKGHFKKRFQFDDILYSEIRPRNHHYGYVMFDASEYIASTRLMVIRAITSKVSPALLYQYLLLPDVEAEFTLKTESRSGTFPQGNYADMASIMVPYSSIESQSAVSDVLLQIRKTIAQNQLENRHLEELRDTLLPRLMSGEIDVSAIDI